MSNVKNVKAGDTVIFKGYGPDVAEADQILTDDAEYTVVEVDVKEKKISVSIENPEFNPKKKESDDNPKTLLVEVFEEEFDLPAAEEAPAAAPVKAAARTKPAPAASAKAAPAKAAAPVKAGAVAKPAKAAPAAPAAPAEEEEAAPEVEALTEEDAEILKLVEDTGEDGLIDLARELAADSANIDYKLGGIFYHIHLSGSYKALDKRYEEKGGYGLFVKEQMQVEYRKAMYLEKIYVTFNKFGIDGAKLAEIGWAKAAKISEVMDADNAQELLTLAESNSVSDLVENIKVNYKEVGGQKGEKKKVVIYKFRAFEDSADVITAALEGCAAAMNYTGSKALDQAFEHIVTEWASEHAVSAPAKAPAGAKRVAAPAKAAPKAAPTGTKVGAKPAARARA